MIDVKLTLPPKCPVCDARQISSVKIKGEPEGRRPMVYLSNAARYRCGAGLINRWIAGGHDGTEIIVETGCPVPTDSAIRANQQRKETHE